MTHALRLRVLVVAAMMAAFAAIASPSALAAITPTMSLDQSAGKAAGAFANLGLDLKFADTGTDSPHNLTINLPPGLLANASINGGTCLTTTNTSGTACEVGSGTVTASPDAVVIGLPASIPVPVTFYLVPPPAPGDLAGLTVIGNVLGVNEQLGSTGDIKIRPSGDPGGVGVTINLALPNQLTLSGLTVPLVTISVNEINSTFDGLRYPTTCPSTPARVTASVDSYQDTTVHALSAPLSVTGCSSLGFAPSFKVTAVRDSGDRQVTVGTTITQTATQAPSSSVSLAFPASTLAPNLMSIKMLCVNLASGTCHPVGSVSATSPLYPKTLSGNAYLTGSSRGPALTLVFPSPFPLTLSGAVDLVKNAATFTGLPDIPVTNLGVSLNGGAEGLYLSTCRTPSGTATATLTSQNGDKTVAVPARFAVSGCPGVGNGPASNSGGSGGGSGGASGGSGGSSGAGGNGSTAAGVTVGNTNLSRGRLSGLRTGRASLSFKLSAAKRVAKLRALTIELPAGLSFVRHGVGRRFVVTVVTVRGATIKALALSHGRLVITLRKPVWSVAVNISPSALSESAALTRRAKAKKLRSLMLRVITETTRATRTTVRVQITNLGL
jgi:hypothetical protein